MMMPSEIEQNIAEWYVLERELVRPNTSIKKAIVYIIGFIALNIIISILLLRVFDWLGFFSFEGIVRFRREHKVWFNILFYIAVLGANCILISRFIAIGAIRLYQRYASVAVRRSCLCMPTCSEYSIMAFRKYGTIIGLYLTYIRLYKRCRGNIYTIDYPKLRQKKPKSEFGDPKYDIYIVYRFNKFFRR